ncbi:toxin of the ChpA-ChpR toxin-antitoxin system, endoribonuclease [uncultured Sphingopyxis sp.]|uniref:Toxin of the ChpA-ChpR toxin-antitoxin system, endoribonuclease n=1 Tax=uncultured Sphingopyxis sp. TaxID=310581 RepID=A0A1Y5PZR0_9SPHN|nr:endoribonuclease MazF [uncultured Sphingopyxis sp.]SBV32724.1 toxin of the ChpA-ChpR toxin-antitoxin system, endoribonuclease [uncultured Sphingopyxis sp.]
MVSRYVPDTGDIVWLQFDPQAGHEQAGHRPALVLSPAAYNKTRGMMICCPMTSQIKGYPFEVVVSQAPPSVALSDQIKSLDWKARGARKKGAVSKAVIDEVRAKVGALLGF